MSILNFYGRRMTFLGVPDRVPSRFVLINGLRSPGKPIRIKLVGGLVSDGNSHRRRRPNVEEVVCVNDYALAGMGWVVERYRAVVVGVPRCGVPVRV